MKRSILSVFVTGLVLTTAGGLAACSRSATADSSATPAAVGSADGAAASTDNGPQYAQVVSVTPVRQSVNDPQRECHDQVVTHTAPPADQHRIAGTAIGAVAGGLLGHMVGGGRGNTLATVAGAVGGGYAGNRIEADHQHAQVSQTVERQCDTVDNRSSRIIGYDVQYVYNGVTRTTRMDHDPGNRVQVQEGVTAVSDAR